MPGAKCRSVVAGAFHEAKRGNASGKHGEARRRRSWSGGIAATEWWMAASETSDYAERGMVANGAIFILVRRVSSVCESTIDLLLASGGLRTNGRIASKLVKNGALPLTRS